MSEKTGASEDKSDTRGCLFILGIVIIAIAIGNIYGAAAGWIVLGIVMIATSIIGR